MGTATIVKVAGRVGGGGAELAASCDMRFGVLGRTMVNQMEVPIGILPGGSGTQRLPRLVGRGRAMEFVLGGIDVDADTVERWGWLNRAFATRSELDTYVDDLARRIASFPPDAVSWPTRPSSPPTSTRCPGSSRRATCSTNCAAAPTPGPPCSASSAGRADRGR